MKKTVNINPPLKLSETMKRMAKSMKKPGVSAIDNKSPAEIKGAQKVNPKDPILNSKPMPQKPQPVQKGVSLNLPMGPKGSGAGSLTISSDPNKKKKTSSMTLVSAPAQAPQSGAAPMTKDDQPHPAGSPEERSHAVAEGMAPLPQAVQQLPNSDAKKRFFDHLKTLRDKSKHRSPENVMKSEGEGKYVKVDQHWAKGIWDHKENRYANPVRDAGKSKPEHMDDIHKLKERGFITHLSEHKEPPKAEEGMEVYKVHSDGKLTHHSSSHDTSD